MPLHDETGSLVHNGITGFDATTPEDRDAILRLVRHYEGISNEVHLPFLDHTLLEKYVVRPVLGFAEAAAAESSSSAGGGGGDDMARYTDGHVVTFLNAQEARSARDVALNKLVVLVSTVTEHKQRTLEVLEAVVRRDASWQRLMQALQTAVSGAEDDDGHGGDENAGAPSSSAGPAAPTPVSVDAAAIVQHCLYQLQRASLHVVETITAWREGLTLPHPFMVGNENYLLKMMTDVARLAADSRLAKVIPMQSLFFSYPLCSNLPSLARFAEDPAKVTFSKVVRSSHGYGPVLDASTTKRLQNAEQIILGEVETQIHVVQQLLDLCTRNRFLPVLNVRKLYPQAYQHQPTNQNSSSGGVHGSQTSHLGPGASSLRGIPVRNAALQQKLEHTLLHALHVLQNPAFRSAYDKSVAQNSAVSSSEAQPSSSQTTAA